jgi:hypothetical protein
MKRFNLATVFLIVLMLLTFLPSAQSQIPRTLSYQGVLVDDTGNPKPDGPYSISFRIYDVSSGGTELWLETKSLDLKRGLFSTVLGDVTPFDAGMKFDKPYWLGIQVSADPELSPRVALTSTGYSLNSVWAESAKVGLISVSDTLWKMNGTNTYHVGGNVGIGTSNPGAGFVVSGTGLWSSAIGIENTNAGMEWRMSTTNDQNFNFTKVTGSTFTPMTLTVNGNINMLNGDPASKVVINGSNNVKDTLRVGSSLNTGRLNLYQEGSDKPIVSLLSDMGGGVINTYDEMGNRTSEIFQNGWGEGGVFNVYNNATGAQGFSAIGNAYGEKYCIASIYGTDKSAVFNMGAAGNNSVQLPDSSISSAEILDEPGIATQFGPAFFFLTNTTANQVVDSVTINVPAAGKVIVATGYVNVFHSIGTVDNVAVNLLTDKAGSIWAHGVSSFTIPAEYPTPSFPYARNPFACKNIFNMASAGSITIYLIVSQVSGAAIGSSQLAFPVINATYYPTAYGNTPVALNSFSVTSDGTSTPAQAKQSQVTYQTAEEFNAYTKQIYQTELDQLKTRLNALEKKIDGSSK